MECSIESNFKIKALIIILIASIVLALSSFFCSVKAAELNRKVNFIGPVYKTRYEGAKIKKEYTEEKPGCGIVLRIAKNKEHGVYIGGEGWISDEQIIDSTKFIDLHFNFKEFFEELREGKVTPHITIDGEFVNVEIANTNIATFEDGELVFHSEGTTDIKFIKRDGTEINAVAGMHDLDATLSLPKENLAEGLSTTLTGGASANLFEKANVDVAVDAKATMNLDEEGFHAELKGTETDEAIIGATITDMEGNEIVTVGAGADAKIDANLEKVEVSGNANQAISLLQKINVALSQKVGALINKAQVKVNAGGDLTAGEKEVAKVDGEVEYTYGAEDPTGAIEGQVFGKTFEKSGRIPLISGTKALINKLSALIAK